MCVCVCVCGCGCGWVCVDIYIHVHHDNYTNPWKMLYSLLSDFFLFVAVRYIFLLQSRYCYRCFGPELQQGVV